jgi:hypothetical protein
MGFIGFFGTVYLRFVGVWFWVCFLHFPLVLILIYHWGKNGFPLFPSSHHCPCYC